MTPDQIMLLVNAVTSALVAGVVLGVVKLLERQTYKHMAINTAATNQLEKRVSQESSVQIQAWRELADYRAELRVENHKLREEMNGFKQELDECFRSHAQCEDRLDDLEVVVKEQVTHIEKLEHRITELGGGAQSGVYG